MKTHHARILLAALLLGSILLGTSPLHAQTSVTYIGPANGSWINGSNWTGGVAPTTTAFNATVNVGSVVSVPSSTNNLTNFNLFGSTSGTGVILVAGQTVIGDGASLGHGQLGAHGGLTFQGSATSGTAIFNGNGTAPTTATWNSGTLSFTGSGVINAANATWNANSGLYDSVSGTITFENQGTFNKNGGLVLTIEPVFAQGSTGTLNVNDGELQLLGGGGSFTSGVTNVLGTSTLTLGGSFNFTGTGSLSVASTATLNIVSSTTNVNFPYNHVGTATVASGGTLRLMGSGNHSGSFVPAAGGVVQIGSGTHVITPTATLGGAGSLNITGGTVALDNGVALAGAASININGGTLASSSTASLAHPLTLNSGTLNVAGALTVGSPFTFNGGQVNGTGTLTVAGPLTWNGGSMNDAGTTQANGGVTFATATEKLVQSGRILNLGQSSSSLWSDGNIALGHTGSTLRIESGSTLTATGNNTIRVNQIVVGSFINEGTFTKNGGTGTTTISGVNFTNSGTISVETGTLVFDNNGTHSGAISLASGTTLSIISRTQSLNAGTTFSGAGTLALSAGTLQVNVPVSTPGTMAVNMSGGTINGSGALTINGLLTWSGGTMANAVTTQANGGVSFTTTANKVLDGARTLSLGQSSSSTWYDGNILAHFAGATLRIESGSTLTAAGNNTFYASHVTPGTFINQGTFTKNGGTGTTTISAVSVNNTGTVKVESGTLLLNYTVTQHSGTTLTGGTWNVTSTTPNSSTLTFANGSNITTIGSAAKVTLDGVGSTFNRIVQSSNALTPNSTLTTNQGSFTIKNDRDVTTNGAFTNSGTVRVEGSDTALSIGGTPTSYTQTGGQTIIVNGRVLGPSDPSDPNVYNLKASVFNLNGGTLGGTGTITGNVIAASGSTISPGLSPGTLAINGNLSLNSGSILLMELGGLNQGSDYDYLNVNGVLTLAGLLDLDFIDNFQNNLTSGEILTLATADSAILGSFSNVASGSYLMTNFPIALQVFYGAGSPYGAENLVVAIPEPSRALLMMLGGLAMLQRRRRAVPALI